MDLDAFLASRRLSELSREVLGPPKDFLGLAALMMDFLALVAFALFPLLGSHFITS